MKVKLIENITDTSIKVKTTGGAIIDLAPNDYVSNVDVTNISELKDNARVVYDLTEVIFG